MSSLIAAVAAPSSTSTSTTLEPICHGDFLKAAAILNNSAIHLLVAQSYQEASVKLKHATLLMKDLAGYLDGEVAEHDLRRQLGQAQELALACSRQAVPYPQDIDDTTSRTTSAATQQVIVQTMSCEFDPSSFHTAVAASATIQTHSSQVKFPFTIDLSACEMRSNEALDVDFYSSVILYNYGVTYDCMATSVAATPVARAYFYQKASRIFDLTSNLLELQLRDDWGHPKTSCTDGRILQLQSFVTHKLMQVCVSFNLSVEYHAFGAKLEEILLTIEVLEQLLSTRQYCAAVA